MNHTSIFRNVQNIEGENRLLFSFLSDIFDATAQSLSWELQRCVLSSRRAYGALTIKAGQDNEQQPDYRTAYMVSEVRLEEHHHMGSNTETDRVPAKVYGLCPTAYLCEIPRSPLGTRLDDLWEDRRDRDTRGGRGGAEGALLSGRSWARKRPLARHGGDVALVLAAGPAALRKALRPVLGPRRRRLGHVRIHKRTTVVERWKPARSSQVSQVSFDLLQWWHQ